jgi:mono/diheme cytochrome c family protein
MKRKLMSLFSGIGIVAIIMAFFAFIVPQDQKVGAAWNIPANYKSMKNPQKANAELEKVGKLLFAKHCKSCHGGVGEGDGPKAASMKTKINSFKDPKFQAQSDGVIYYQSFVGRDEMPNFEKKILEEEDRWAIVNYMRTLK